MSALLIVLGIILLVIGYPLIGFILIAAGLLLLFVPAGHWPYRR